MSELIASLPNNMTRGITLNYQHIDLFLILDDKSKSDEVKRTEIIEYLKECKESQKTDRTAFNLASAYTNYTADKLGIEDVEKLKSVLLQNVSSVFDRNALTKAFAKNGYENPEELNDTFMEATDNVMNRTKEGITDFLIYDDAGKIDINRSFVKVNAFYSLVISGEYNRINFDDIASPSSYMALQPDFARPKKLENALEFCNNHNLSAKINSAFFYMHSQYPESPVINTKDDLIRYYETYFNSISEVINNSKVESYDIFNEFVYRDQPQIVQTQEGEKVEYGERHNGIHSILTTKDFCDLAKGFRAKNPKLEFVYNDDGWENPQKRSGIFRKIDEIQSNEDYKGQLINAIGMQFHTNINIDISQIRKSVEECQKRFPELKVNITELDITKEISGFDYKNATEQELESAKRVANFKQKQIMNEIKKLADNSKLSELTFWSQSDEMAFRGKESSMINYNSKSNSYVGKDFEYSEDELLNYKTDIEIVARNIAMSVAKEFRTNNIDGYKKILERSYMKEAVEYFESHQDEIIEILAEHEQKPIQDFNLHTHTMRCGHAGSFTEDYEYVHEAIKAGMKKIAFTDHVPFPKGQKDFGMRMDYAEVEDYFASIKYLKQEYTDVIEVESGFEFEYSKELDEHLRSLKSKSDYMILGQHFVTDENGNKIDIQHNNSLKDSDLELYAQSVETSIRKGLTDIVAHPDIYLRNSGKGDSNYQMSDKEREVAERICEICAMNNIPLEINMGEIFKKGHMIKDMTPEEMMERIKNPSREFWKIAAEKECKVLFGKDAHDPMQISEDKDYEVAKMLLGEDVFKKLNFMTFDEINKSNKKISKRDLESLANSPKIDTPVQTLSTIMQKTMEKDKKGVSLDD